MAEIYNIDFEGGDFSELTGDSTGGAQLYVSGVDPITGSFSCNHDWDGVAQAVSNSTSLAGSTTLRLGLRIKIKAAFDWGTTQTQVGFFDFLNGTNEYTIGLEKSGANTIALLASTTSADLTGTTNLDDGAAHTIEMRIVKESAPAAGDGVNALYVDGLLEAENAAVSNTTEFEAVLIGVFNWQWTRLNASSGSGHAGGIITDDWILRNDDTQIYPPTVAATDEFTVAPMKKPADIDGDGTNIYIAALNSLGFPILIQFATALNADGSVVFNPGAGDNIGVECSRGDGDEITVAGQFDGTNVVERSEDAGVSFSVIDDATIGGIGAFKVGPDSDNRILVFDEDNSDLLETIDEGSNWTSINASVSQTIKAMARLGVNVQEAVFGTSSADTAQVLYSINSGNDLEDLEDEAFGADVDVNGVIIN